MEHYDVLIVGAGAAGLIAALELSLVGKKIAVLEAKEEIGGRARSFYQDHFEKQVEAGAEFVHGNLELTQTLLKKAGIKYYEVTGELWQKTNGNWDRQKDFIENFNAVNRKLKSLKQDMSVKQFIIQHLSDPEFENARFTLENYVEGYYAANIEKASTFSLRDELNKSNDEQYRIEGGYSKLFAHLFKQCIEKGVQFYFSHTVNEIFWERGKVSITAQHKNFTAQKLLITVPIGVLQSRSIRFSPTLEEKENAASQLGFGGVIKTILQFKEPFWKNEELTKDNDLDKLAFVFSEADVPTWWTQYPEERSILTGWNAGRHANKLKHLSNDAILEKALQSLAMIFEVKVELLQRQLIAWHLSNWINDPYCCGGYSYEVVNGGDAKKILRQPVENTIWFTGEGLFEGAEIGTVNAALVMGRNSAHDITASFKS